MFINILPFVLWKGIQEAGDGRLRQDWVVSHTRKVVDGQYYAFTYHKKVSVASSGAKPHVGIGNHLIITFGIIPDNHFYRLSWLGVDNCQLIFTVLPKNQTQKTTKCHTHCSTKSLISSESSHNTILSVSQLTFKLVQSEHAIYIKPSSDVVCVPYFSRTVYSILSQSPFTSSRSLFIG